MGITDPSEAGAEPVVVELHEHLAAIGEPIEESLELVVVVAVDPQRDRGGEPPCMIDRTIGTAELAAGETEPGDLDGAIGADVPRP